MFKLLVQRQKYNLNFPTTCDPLQPNDVVLFGKLEVLEAAAVLVAHLVPELGQVGVRFRQKVPVQLDEVHLVENGQEELPGNTPDARPTVQRSCRFRFVLNAESK